MPSVVVGSTVVQHWTLLDVNNTPITGAVAGDFQFRLFRQVGAAMGVASEAISIAEIGVTGSYSITFAPTNTGVYELDLKELHASSGGVYFRFPQITVVAAGSDLSPSYTNAFCSESDIERELSRVIDTSKLPDDIAAAAWAEMRAAALKTICSAAGLPGVSPTTVATAYPNLSVLLRRANAIGAALDYLVAQQFGRSPETTDQVANLAQLWRDYAGGAPPGSVTVLVGLIEQEIKGNLVSLSTDHILSGDTLPAPGSTVVPYNEPIGIGTGDVF